MQSVALLRRYARGVIGGSIVVVGGAITGCDGLLEVDNPSAVEAEALERPENAQLLVTNAITDFECAFGHYIVAGGLIGNEMWNAGLWFPMYPYDARRFDETGGLYATATCDDPRVGFYMPLSTARAQADVAVRVLSQSVDTGVPNRMQLLATAHVYAGYSRLLLGEGMCSAAIDGGPELSSQELFALAEDHFTSALNASPTSEIENMALVGRARARINEGNTAGALADAQLVPPGFVKYAEYSAESDRSSNKVYLYNRDPLEEGASIEDEFHNLEWKGTPDPRVPVTDQGRLAFDNMTPYWTQEKYPSREAPIPIARYEEARLIIAEVEGGQIAVDIINALHAAVGLPPYDPDTDGSILDQVILERERELFLESHHLYDIRRFEKALSPPSGTPYQETGLKSGTYGSTVCLPLPLLEKNNNPNIP
ncbi:RagB/SusD family nutrient uptake outer membrane protein [Gemmatimonadota bacterium]